MNLIQRLKWIRQHGPAEPPLRHVLEVLTSFDDDAGRALYPCVERLARETAYHPRSVRRYLAALVRAGWLQPEKPARESRPAGIGGREAWWVHGNLGGRKHSTRYRMTMRVAGETLTTCPDKPGHRVRVPKASKSETLTACPETLTACPDNPDRVSGDPVLIRNDPGAGKPSPIPPPGMVAPAAPVPLAAAGAAGYSAAGAAEMPHEARKARQGALIAAGCQITGMTDLTAWEALADAMGLVTADEVSRRLKGAVWRLCEAWKAAHGAELPRPYPAAELAPYVPAVARTLDLTRAMFRRILPDHHKATA